METRQILIADTKTQRRYAINTNATTLGELMDQMTLQGIDYTGMSFTEGISKTSLISRDSLLPTNVMYKGQPTNNLVMLLTNTSKNIASGCEGKSRKEAYSIIKELGQDAMNEIKDIYGRNYTQVSTANLWEYIDENYDIEEDDELDEEEDEDTTPTGPVAAHPATVEWLYGGIKAMVAENTLYLEDVEVLAELIDEYAARLRESKPFLSDSEVDDIIASL